MAAIDNVNLREGTVIRIFLLRFQLFARLFFVRLYRSNRPHTFGFASMGLPARQQEINDRQQHHHESIDKVPAISQHENVTENYGGTPPNTDSAPHSPTLPSPVHTPPHHL